MNHRSSFLFVLLLAAVIALPMVLRPRGQGVGSEADETLVIMTPHNEATRSEFAAAFAREYRERTGRTVAIDWRTPGGGSEIARYLASEYLGAFRLYWERDLGRQWTREVEAAFDNPQVAPGEESIAAQARKAFLESPVSCGVDLLFGGGSYDFSQQAAAGRLVNCGLLEMVAGVPPSVGGEPYWDREGRWIGAALSAFGICYHREALARAGITTPPTAWSDLADPRLFGRIALSDPTQSGSAAKAFEMLVQQQIAATIAEGGTVADGWARAMRLIRRISANARYFTDSASKVPWDVESGDAAAGMVIDFYGRYQSEAVRRPDGSSRMEYVTPRDGSSFGSDPIGLLRGAPHEALAREFIRFVMAPEGQKLWNWKVGTPGGPQRHALRRLPVLPSLYEPQWAALRSDPEVDPYRESTFVYHPEWTARLFRTIGFVIGAMAIDAHDELCEAWRALIRNGFPREATARFDEITAIDYDAALHRLRPLLSTGSRMDQVRLSRELGDHFRRQYREVTQMADRARE
ncbi:MAG TPA: extracellular solute-binding protein [Chthoniobacteraceae bacterium]|nr:extracellular solute-binding protein [Chthoniobacteraceae bacterium]